jgi:hypothetical protein
LLAAPSISLSFALLVLYERPLSKEMPLIVVKLKQHAGDTKCLPSANFSSSYSNIPRTIILSYRYVHSKVRLNTSSAVRCVCVCCVVPLALLGQTTHHMLRAREQMLFITQSKIELTFINSCVFLLEFLAVFVLLVFVGMYLVAVIQGTTNNHTL